MREIIGMLMLAAPCIGLFIFIAWSNGLRTALAVYVSVAGLMAWAGLALYFILGGKP